LLDAEGLQPPSDANTLARMLSRSASLLQARSCGVLIWDRDKNVLSAMTPFSGLDETGVKTLEFPVGGSTMGTAVLQDRPVLLDGEDGNGHIDTELLQELKIQNAVTVPLALERRDENNEVVERQIMGVFCAFDKYYGRPFDMEDARLLTMMARQVSAVLVTSQIYWKEVERTKRIMSMIESTSVGLMGISPKGTVTQVNAAARMALGIEEQVWFGRQYNELTDNRDVCDLIEDAIAGAPPEAPREITLQVKTNDDTEEHIYRVQIDEIRSEDRQALGWVIVFENVTDIRRAEQMMAAFVDMVSHELRTPLTSIRGFVATLLQAGEGMFPWETQEEFLQIVDTEAERLGQMIDDLLNIARIQNGRGLQYHFVPTKMETVCAQVVRLQSQSSYMKGAHKLTVDVPEDFPEVYADDAKLTQVLHNLVSNALKYSPNGGEVKIAARLDGEGYRLTISDQGLGIPKEQLPKMFGQFFRVEGHSHQGIKGTGLGLWLTKHMIEDQHGRIWVESEFGHGSQFHIWLPRDPNRYGGKSGS
jgi:PAS domain S-box-containing protein